MNKVTRSVKSRIGSLVVSLGLDKLIPPDEHQLFTHDKDFHTIYENGLRMSGSFNSKRRRPRNYNMIAMFKLTGNLKGEVAEAGCWKGMSSFLLCHYIKKTDTNFTGKGFHIFDSFEGLSAPIDKDEDIGEYQGRFAMTVDHVSATLAEFPDVTFHKGWIPDCFPVDEDTRYRFVHIDVDLYQPIFDSLEYFWPRMAKGGIIALDDYGSMAYPGAKKAVDEFCEREHIPVAHFSTINAVIIKP